MNTKTKHTPNKLPSQTKAVASYAIGRAYRANRQQRNPLSMDELKSKIGNHLTGRQEWPEFKMYFREGCAAVFGQ